MTTDSSGAFQFLGVLPGKYIVGTIQSYGTRCTSIGPTTPTEPFIGSNCSVYPVRGTLPLQGPSTERTRVHATTFYPGTLEFTDAHIITIRAGQQVGGIDFTVEAFSTVRLSGILSDPTSGPVSSAVISLTRIGNKVGAITADLTQAVASTDKNGRFVVAGVPAGDYDLRAVSNPKVGVDKGPFYIRIRTVTPSLGASLRASGEFLPSDRFMRSLDLSRCGGPIYLTSA